MTLAKPKVVILGGGFAGLAAAARLNDRHDVTLVDRGADFEYLPGLHELVSRCTKPRSLRLSRERLVTRHGHRFLQAEVATIDPERREVKTVDGGVLPYDALIVALGSAASTHGVPGAAEHAVGLRTIAEGVAIGARLKRLAADDQPRAVTIVGGGFTGVECLGEVLRRHRQRRRLTVRLIEPHSRLLAGQPRVVHRVLRQVIDECDAELLLDERVAALEPGCLQLASGSWLRSDLTVWTAGGGPPALLAEAGLAPPGEWVPVRRTLQSRADERVFVAGDDAEPRRGVSKQSYHARAMGRRAAKNVARLLAGRDLQKHSPPDERLLITFGYLAGFYVDDDVVLEGAALCFARQALLQLDMVELDRARGSGGRRRLLERIRDATRLRAWPGPLRAVAPFPFGRAPRDRFDLPALPRILEWRRAGSGPEAAAAAAATAGRLGRSGSERAPDVLRFVGRPSPATALSLGTEGG